MSALAQPTRYRCYALLAVGGPLTAGEIAERLDVPANLLSSHLSVLAAAGLITANRRGRCISYKANAGALLGLIAHLATISGEDANNLPQL
ncbi:ArsR/SmtB family transcription factor [Sphingomonas sp. SAFR-052]|uniref:ArsR/SmtB family transcription factor n=1 Tax=Sphingomonas sp. SAFR-052 TaxID=3436867 RepID=UPI003F814632